MITSYDFLIETYKTERIKILSAWRGFHDDDLLVRPRQDDVRGRNLLEQMVHQCVSEDYWFQSMLAINVTNNPLPDNETRDNFIQQYANDSRKRCSQLKRKSEAWWTHTADFFGVPRSRAWIMTRRIAHSSHHRGQLTFLMRMTGQDLYSTYGPTADTGGLMQNNAPTIYLFSDEKIY